MSSRHLQDMSSRRLQDMSSRRFQDVFNVTIFRLPRRLQKVFARRLQDVFEDVKLLCWRRVEDVFKTNKYLLGNVFKISSRHVFKTSSRHVCKASSRHVFKTSSRRLQHNNFSSSKIVTPKTCWRRLQDKQMFVGLPFHNVLYHLVFLYFSTASFCPTQ